jgi:hypothetical protein
MEVNRESRTMCNTETSKVISRTDPMIPTDGYLEQEAYKFDASHGTKFAW